ncbi:MAG: hypothetical protein F4X66_17100 [Chloroflexi bacterium]|nr:hypothetical protein [Chloroflexota bacterium]MYE41624.1 hypothetical protein [Chloroflexota bacterium]
MKAKAGEIQKQIRSRTSTDSIGIPVVAAAITVTVWITDSIESNTSLIALLVVTGICVLLPAVMEERKSIGEKIKPQLVMWGITTLLYIVPISSIIINLGTPAVQATIGTLVVAALLAGILIKMSARNPIVITGAAITAIPLGIAWITWAIQTPSRTDKIAVF